MLVGACWINMGILFTNRKLPSIHSEPVQRSRWKANTYSYAEEQLRNFAIWVNIISTLTPFHTFCWRRDRMCMLGSYFVNIHSQIISVNLPYIVKCRPGESILYWKTKSRRTKKSTCCLNPVFFFFFREKLNMVIKMISDKVANIVGKWENAGYRHFLLFPQCFQKIFFPVRVDKTRGRCCKGLIYCTGLFGKRHRHLLWFQI